MHVEQCLIECGSLDWRLHPVRLLEHGVSVEMEG